MRGEVTKPVDLSMLTLTQLKESELTLTPLLLFDCIFSDGTTRHWCTQAATVKGTAYEPRVWRNNLFEVQTASDQGVDAIPKLTLELANADSLISELERNKGFKGARLTCRFVFYDSFQDLADATATVLFLGICNSPDLITETTLRVTAMNRLSAQRVALPSLRVQRRCAWDFPVTVENRAEAVSGGVKGENSRFYSCGYSADQAGGVGNLNGAECYNSCAFTRRDCESRGMFNADSRGNPTARFSGIEFVPSTITVRSAGEKGSHASPLSVSEARYNDFIPMVYGTAWYTPSIVFARNDGNLTRMEVLLGVGEMTAVHKVLVSDIDIPQGKSGMNMTGTGWFNVVTLGGRNGEFNRDFTSASGIPLGDPYGGLALLSVVVPNRINDGKSLPEVKVLVDGLKVDRFDESGLRLPKVFSNNPAWIILNILLRNGWDAAELDLGSFAKTAAYGDELISAKDLNSNTVQIPRFQCNLVLKSRRSAGDVLRGVRNGSRLFLTFGAAGLLQLRVEDTLAIQQASKSLFSNATTKLDGGWPTYEFGDGTEGTSGILRNADGTASLRVSSRGASDTANRFAVEFQDAFNEYQQDSFSLTDPEDVAKAGQEISITPTVLGLPNYNQAARILQFLLSKSVAGNVQVEFQTSVKALGIAPGDIIALTYLREGFERQPFRVTKVAPGPNFRTVGIVAQLHNDDWYTDSVLDNFGSSRRLPSANLGLPRPVSGILTNEFGELQFKVTESSFLAQDGTATVLLDVEIATPPALTEHGAAIPMVALTPILAELAGGLAPSTTVYYGFSGLDISGNEGPLSFIVRAHLPETGLGYSVTLSHLSFSADTAAFHVYRGISPLQLNRIATSVLVSEQFTDTGLPGTAMLPPDINFHHSNLYWRLEIEGEMNATLHSALTIGNSLMRMIINQDSGLAVRIIRGTGVGQERFVASNTQTILTLVSAWDIEPDAGSVFVVSQAAFQIGATGHGTHFQWEVPNREGTVVQILGRSANAAGVECPAEISPLTRWVIGGAGVRTMDTDVASAPFFGLGLGSGINGTVELSGIGFVNLTNTATAVAGTLTMYWQDELAVEAAVLLSSAINATDVSLAVSGLAITNGSLIRLQSELMRVDKISAGGTVLSVTRSLFGTSALAMVAGTTVVPIRASTVTVPFPRHFFGTPASGNWSYLIPLENARVAAANFFVTNSQGNSIAASQAYTNTIDQGLRTLSGGQYSLQLSGPLAIENSAAPEVVLEADHAVGYISGYLREPPTGSGVQVRINLNLSILCTLDFTPGSIASNGVRGTDLPVLRQGDRLSIDVTSIGSILPGSDLTVIIKI